MKTEYLAEVFIDIRIFVRIYLKLIPWYSKLVQRIGYFETFSSGGSCSRTRS